MDYAFYIASALGALAVWMMMPADRPKPTKLGALLGVVTLGGLLLYLLNQTAPEARPNLYYYVFTILAVASAVRVITHPRPVYAALFFVMVVLSVSGLFIVLEAEFMAFAMIIIYAGAILVTYLFVIMLATLPQAEGQEEQSPLYDRMAREPFSSALVGFALVAVLSSAMFAPGVPTRSMAELARPAELVMADKMPGRLTKLLTAGGLLTDEQADRVAQYGVYGDELLVYADDQSRIAALPLDGDTRLREVIAAALGNIDSIGINLFEGHPLGIELAGVVLLLSMVGAIVIGRKQLLAELDAGGPATPGAGGATAQPTEEPGPDSPQVLDSTSEGALNRG